MSKDSMSLSVIIICKNEYRVIEKTLKSVHGWATEIVVLDSGSEDNTVEIAKKYTDKVFLTDWPGYGKQKNRALSKATCEWVLSIDADEQLTEKLRNEISTILKNKTRHDAYRIPVRLLYFGQYVRSLLKRKPLILARRELCRFTEPNVHEALKINGSIGSLKNPILHNSYESLHHQINKLNHYAELWAIEKHSSGKSTTLSSAFVHAFWMLFRDLFIVGAVFDGWRGVLLSFVHANYTFNKYAFLKTKSTSIL